MTVAMGVGSIVELGVVGEFDEGNGLGVSCGSVVGDGVRLGEG